MLIEANARNLLMIIGAQHIESVKTMKKNLIETIRDLKKVLREGGKSFQWIKFYLMANSQSKKFKVVARLVFQIENSRVV